MTYKENINTFSTNLKIIDEILNENYDFKN